jgi:hypothetical protein
MSIGNRFAQAQTPAARFDLSKPLDGWTIVSGKWAIEDVAGAAQGGRALVQRATDNDFNVIVAPGGPFGNVDVAVRFKPMSGREDASGGIVFRFSEGRYYVIRANALESNFNFYYYDRGRREIAGASVKAPALGQWHAGHGRRRSHPGLAQRPVAHRPARQQVCVGPHRSLDQSRFHHRIRRTDHHSTGRLSQFFRAAGPSAQKRRT